MELLNNSINNMSIHDQETSAFVSSGTDPLVKDQSIPSTTAAVEIITRPQVTNTSHKNQCWNFTANCIE
jgi:hypothetical protein